MPLIWVPYWFTIFKPKIDNKEKSRPKSTSLSKNYVNIIDRLSTYTPLYFNENQSWFSLNSLEIFQQNGYEYIERSCKRYKELLNENSTPNLESWEIVVEIMEKSIQVLNLSSS